MDTQNENVKLVEDDMVFPLTKEEYYYRCRISNVEKAKSEYNKCVNVLLRNKDAILSDISNKENVVSQLEKYYKHFNEFSDNIIGLDGLDSKENYVRNMELLMCIVQDTVVFISEKYGLLKKKTLNQKYSFKDDSFHADFNESCDNSDNKRKLSYIVNQIVNVQYYLNPDDPINVIPDKYSGFIIPFIYPASIFLLLFITLIGLGLLRNIFPISDKVIGGIALIIALIFPTVGFLKFMNSRRFLLAERRSRAYSQTYHFVIHPYKGHNKMNLRRILNAAKDLVSFVKSFKK